MTWIELIFCIINPIKSQECGTRLTDSTGFIQSQNYPNRYPNNYECSWVIGESPTDTVTLTAEGFNVEPVGGCSFDYLEVQTTELTGRYCGRTSRDFGPDRTGILVATGAIQVIFVSDSGDQYRGFRIRYEISTGEAGCIPNPCQNNGLCIDIGDGTIECFCEDGYFGPRCEIGNDPCSIGPCRNGGTCTATGTATDEFECRCIPGFVGRICTIDEDNCAMNLCQNGGMCIDDLNNFNCDCANGYSGPVCQIENNPCIPNPCQNGGFCDRRGSDVFCICNGFFGQFCEMNQVEMSTPNLQLIPTMSWLTNATDTLTGSDDSSKIGLYLAITGACLAVVATAGGIGLLIHNKDLLPIQYFLQSFLRNHVMI